MDIKAIIILVALANLFLGGLLFFKGKRTKANIAFAVTSASFGIWALGLYFYECPIWFSSFIWIKIVYSLVLIPLIPSYFYFALIFPKHPKSNKKIIFPMLAYFLPAILLLSILWFSNLWVKDVISTPEGIQTILGPAYIFFLALACFFGFFWFIGLVLKNYATTSGIVKMQLRYILIGLSLCVLFIVTLDGIIPLTTGNSRPFWLSPLGSLFLIIATAYAITRYRLMDVRLMLQKTGVFLLALSIVVGLTISSIWLMAYLMNYSPNPILMIGGAVAMAITILLFVPLRSGFQKIADKLFFRKIISYQQALKEVSGRLAAIIDLDRLAELIVETTKNTMGLTRAGVLLRDAKTAEFYIQKVVGFEEENGISLVKDNFLTEHLQKTKKPVVYEELQMMIKDAGGRESEEHLKKLKSNMERIEAVLCLPLIAKDNLRGIIVLGGKLSQDAYSKEDLELLETLASQTSIAIENARLYNQVRDLSANLQEKVDEQTKSLKELLDMKSKFLNTVSHQLRTPTTIFRSMLSMITEGSLTKEKKEEFIEDSYTAANRLLIIIEGILEANTFEGKTPSFDFKLCNLGDTLQETINIFKNIAEKKRVILEYQKSTQKLPEIMADAYWLRSAFTKVIDNAIWYTRENGRVSVSACFNKQANTIAVKVQDTGIGLTQGDKKILFKKFSRGRGSWDMNVNSSGLGLYIAKKIVEGHHGEITAQSEGEDKGSIFTITLPIMQEI